MRTAAVMTKKTLATVASAALALAGLTACGDTAEQTATETVVSDAADTVVSESVVTETVSEDDDRHDADDDRDDADDADKAGGASNGSAGSDLPAAVSGYSDDARAEMAEEGIIEADVEAALAAALNGDAAVEWDDGIWEIEWQHVDIDINPGGVVLDADR